MQHQILCLRCGLEPQVLATQAQQLSLTYMLVQATFNNLEQAIARYYSQAEEGLSNGGTKTDEELARELSMADSGPMRGGPSGIPQARSVFKAWTDACFRQSLSENAAPSI